MDGPDKSGSSLRYDRQDDVAMKKAEIAASLALLAMTPQQTLDSGSSPR